MATMGKKIMLLGLVVAALAMAAHVQGAVTIYNAAGLVVDVLVDDKNVKVATEMVTVNLTQAQEDIQFKVADGEVMEVTVQDGDVLVLILDPTGSGNMLALKVQVDSAESLTSATTVPGPVSQVEISQTPALP